HDGRRADPAPHDVADDQGRAAAAEGDDVVPVAADRGLGAAGVVGGGDAQVVGVLQFLGEQGALEGDGGLALAAFAGAQAFGGLGVVGDVGGEDQHAAAAAVAAAGRFGDGGAGEGVGAAAGGLAGLDGAGLAAAQDLVEQGQQADLVELGQGVRAGAGGGGLGGIGGGGPGGGEGRGGAGQAGGFGRAGAGRAGGGAERAAAEGRGVGVVDVGDAVVRAVHQGDEGGDAVEDVPHP